MNPETITLKKYIKNLSGVCLIGLGAFLLIEHIWSWGELSFFDFLGHEWLGLIMIIVGVGLNISFKTRVSIQLIKVYEWLKNIFSKNH